MSFNIDLGAGSGRVSLRKCLSVRRALHKGMGQGECRKQQDKTKTETYRKTNHTDKTKTLPVYDTPHV